MIVYSATHLKHQYPTILWRRSLLCLMIVIDRRTSSPYHLDSSIRYVTPDPIRIHNTYRQVASQPNIMYNMVSQTNPISGMIRTGNNTCGYSIFENGERSIARCPINTSWKHIGRGVLFHKKKSGAEIFLTILRSITATYFYEIFKNPKNVGRDICGYLFL